MPEYYAGRVQAVVFGNDAQSFYILKMALDGDEDLDEVSASVTVRGSVPGLEVKAGTWFGFEAKWEHHDKYGKQLAIQKAPVLKDGWDTATALKMLEGHGVGIRTCNAMYDHFGDDLVKALGDSEELQKVPSITKFSALHIMSRWQTVRALFQSLQFLGDLRLPKNKVEQIYSHFGDDTERALSEDPWSLVQIDGISFNQADEVARRLGLDLASETRLRGAALFTCKSRRGMGHLYLTSGDLVQGIASAAPEVSKPQIAKVLKQLHDEDLLVLDNKTRPGTMAIYEPWFHALEKESAVLLAERQSDAQFDEEGRAEYLELLGAVGPKSEEASTVDETGLADVARTAILEWSEHSTFQLSDNQLNGAVNALVEPVSVLTGLPGTGKTQTLKVVVKVLQDAKIPFLLVAPTGIAAKRLTTVTGAEASTIHRAFGAKGMDTDDDRESTYAGVVGIGGSAMTEDGSKEFWNYSTKNPHPARVVIVDESSMVDQHLLFRLLTCTARNCRVVFVGDAAQLPSVGPGNVLRDIISSGFFPVVDLQEIFRQHEASDIVIAAHAINRGHVPKFDHRSKDFIVVEVRNEQQILDTMTATVQKLYERKTNFQVLSPRHSGTLGVTNLNLRIRELLNPKTPGLKEMRLGAETIREGDRVMVSKNNYRYEIFNGDVGKVVRLDQKGKIVEIKIHGPPVMIVQMTFKDAPRYLRLAYCVTVHKCLHPDTLVETLQGLVPISSLPDIGVVGAPGGSKRYLRKVVNPKALMLKIMTKEGYEISVTPDHGLDVWDLAQETYVRKEARNVAWGDLLRLRMKPEVDAVGPVELLPPEGCQEERLPSVVDAKTAEFLGLFFAAGRRYDSGFYFEHRHPEVAERFTVLCELLFGVKAHRFTERGFYCVEVVSTFLSRWMVQIKAHRADVPACILQSPLTVQRWFLRGLFEAGSVHLCPLDSRLLDRIELPVDSFPLVQKVRTMLLRFGIVCEVREGGVGLQLCGEDAKRFGETIGFITNVKQDQATYLTEPTSRYEVPVGLALFRSLRNELNGEIPPWTCRDASKRHKLSRHAAREILKHSTGSSAQLELAALLEDHHSPVVSINEFESPSVCVEVPEGHRFLQNGFYGWNSQGQEYDVILMPWSSSFRHQLQRNLIYTAITRARKKVILVGHPEAVAKAVGNNRVDARNTLFPERLGEILDDSASPEKG